MLESEVDLDYLGTPAEIDIALQNKPSLQQKTTCLPTPSLRVYVSFRGIISISLYGCVKPYSEENTTTSAFMMQ